VLPVTQKTTSVLLFIAALVGASLACNTREVIGNPIVELPTATKDTSRWSLNDEKRAELQAYMGASQTELISLEPVDSPEDCPPDDVVRSPDGLVTYRIYGDKLTIIENMTVRQYTYDPGLDAFCDEVPTMMIIDQDVIETEVTECVSFSTNDGVKMSNLRRYYDVDGIHRLCYDQRNKIQNEVEDPGEPETGAALIELTLEECNAKNDFSLVVGQAEFSETGDLCNFTIQTANKSPEYGVVLSYYHVHADESESDKEWQQWHYKPGVELEWPLVATYVTFVDGTSSRAIHYWEKAAVYYSVPGCEWIGWDDSNYDKIAAEVSEPPCPMP